MIILFNIYIFIQSYCHFSNAAAFDYKDTTKWKEYFPRCEGHQSPINLSLGPIRKVGDLPPLSWCGYEHTPTKMILDNTGHSIQLSGIWPPNEIPYIQGGPLLEPYVFEQLHFHWGPNNTVGSEHTINGNRFPLEMHMVHFKKQYRTFANATKYRDGLAVVAFLFDVLHYTAAFNFNVNRNIQSSGSDGLSCVLEGINAVQKTDSKTELKPFSLSEFDLAESSVQSVTYHGSLTTPPCSPIVTWILPVTILRVKAEQMNQIRTIELNHGDDHNYRPIQPKEHRNIHILTQWSKIYGSDVYKVGGR